MDCRNLKNLWCRCGRWRNPLFEEFRPAVDDQFLRELVFFYHFHGVLVAADIQVDMGIAAHDDHGAVFLAGS